jgi:hypothetical protein
MKDYLTLGATPCDEACTPVGAENYSTLARKECRAFINQLIREFGDPPIGAALVVKAFPHEFGTYHEVCVKFDDDIQETVDYAFRLESQSPTHWDHAARVELSAD